MAWNKARTVFFSFLNFFPIFYKILDSGPSRKDRKDNFFFLTFSALPNPVWLEMKQEWCFLIFWTFSYFFLEFSILSRVGRIGTIIFFLLTFSSLPNPIWLEMKLEWCFLIFLILLLFFLEFLIQSRVGRIGTIILFCSLSRLFITRLRLKWSYNGVF